MLSLNNITFWMILSSLITMLVLSIIRDIKHMLHSVKRQLNSKYDIGDRVVLRIVNKELKKEILIVGQITGFFFTKRFVDEPIYKLNISKDGEILNAIAVESQIISTEKEMLSFKSSLLSD